MPQPEPATTLPTIQQRIDADYLAANFDALTQARVSGLLPRDADNQLERVQVLPSTQLRQLVHRGATILHDAHLAATPIERLGRQSLQALLQARHALTELTAREAAALDQLEADPPAYLVTAIGRPTPLLRPTDGISRRAWREIAGTIQAYRLQYNITDPTRTLGPRTGGITHRLPIARTERPRP
jgi:glutamate/tyrosine decarboxylase-like PLP-dependent enzyme